MTPKDIFLRALRREPTPRPAVGSATSIVTLDLMHKVGAFFPEAHRDAEVMARLAEAGVTELGFDNVMPLFSVCHESAAMGCQVDWGAVGRMPACRRPPLRLGRQIEIPRDLLTHPACAVALDGLRLLKRRWGEQYAIVGKVFGPWTLGYHLFGIEEFLISTLTDPGAVKAAIESLKEVTVAFGCAQIEAGADALCLADHATRDLCSPAAYGEFLQAVHQELTRRLACPLILHICGDTSDRIGLIRGAGVACFHFDSKVPADTARRLAGERLALMGGTSNLTVIRTGDEQAVRRDVREKLAAGIDIIGPECAVPLDAPYANLKFIADEARKLGNGG